ncbi:hypothetical protein GQ42DRAFT_164896 [Ramicandelaber brevisporus]|nr:hypothetical protein GQ42DRAFT_164896 [Ramicandelaber brevisporus]
MTTRASRAYDILLVGATGFTGSKCAKYLLKHAPAGTKVALCGRSRSKLETLREKLAAELPSAAELAVVVADTADQAAVDAAVSQARVVLATAGPFYRLGTSVVDACARFGTDYVDITGEYEWVRSMHRRYNAVAERSGALIVPFCGFDSLPSELGSLMVADAFRRRYGSDPDEVRHSVVHIKGEPSGGTLETMMSVFSGEAPRSIKASEKEYFTRTPISPKAAASEAVKAVVKTGPKRGTFHWDADVERWQGIFLMSNINIPAVRWSCRLRSVYQNGPNYAYAETQSYGSLFKAIQVAAILATFGFLASFGLGRWILNRILPAPGQGPSDENIAKGSYKGVFIAEKKSEQAGEAPLKVRGHVYADSDPGYGETVRYVCESALCVLNKRTELPLQAGVSPPGYGLGLALLGHLRSVGCDFSVDDIGSGATSSPKPSRL